MRDSGYYILEGRTPKKVENLIDWARGYEKMDRTVAKTQIKDVSVSTVFLAMDHSFIGGPPLFFETLVFGGEHDGHMDRYTTWEEAEKGHHKICEMVVNQ